MLHRTNPEETREVRLGDLVLTGRPSAGRITHLRNHRTGMEVSFPDPSPCWSVEATRGGTEIVLQPADFAAEGDAVRARFTHADLGITVTVEWRSEHPDAAACEIGFRVEDPNVAVTRIVFRTPGPVRLTGADVLIYPQTGGLRIENPAAELFEPVVSETAAWRDRYLGVRERGFDLPESDGARELAFPYSGRCSMQWMDYDGDEGGLYLAAHDPDFEHGLLAATARRGEPGVALRVEKILDRRLASWGCRFVLGLHADDWHRGADIYRAFFDTLPVRVRPPHGQFARGPGLFCHYDLKWQDGYVNHRFSDIPDLAREALRHGFADLMLAGWNVGGFDNLYPRFRPAKELGTEDDLRRAVREAHEAGCRVHFYTNVFSFDEADPDFAEHGRAWAVKDADGEVERMRWGSRTLVGMCNRAAGWRGVVKGNTRYVAETLGADGVYLDQFAVTPRLCHDATHGHDRGWIAGNLEHLDELREELRDALGAEPILFSEFLTDALATRLDAQIMHTCWMNGLRYAFPEMFRYTFPEALVLDQVFQKPWPGDPPEVEARHVGDVFCREFVNGILFWAYDHTVKAPGFGEFFAKAVALRQAFADDFARGRFRDTDGIAEAPPGVTIKTFELPDGALYAVSNPTGRSGVCRLDGAVRGQVVSASTEQPEPSRVESDGDTLAVPAARLSVHRIASPKEER